MILSKQHNPKSMLQAPLVEANQTSARLECDGRCFEDQKYHRKELHKKHYRS